MKVKFYCDSGANAHSCREEILDTEKDLGMCAGQWEEMSEQAREECVKDWMSGHLDWGYSKVA